AELTASNAPPHPQAAFSTCSFPETQAARGGKPGPSGKGRRVVAVESSGRASGAEPGGRARLGKPEGGPRPNGTAWRSVLAPALPSLAPAAWHSLDQSR